MIKKFDLVNNILLTANCMPQLLMKINSINSGKVWTKKMKRSGNNMQNLEQKNPELKE